MIALSEETEELANAIAVRCGVSLEEAVAQAVEAQARQFGIAQRRRQSVEQMLAVGREISTLPLLDPRSPRQIMDEVNVP